MGATQKALLMMAWAGWNADRGRGYLRETSLDRQPGPGSREAPVTGWGPGVWLVGNGKPIS